MKRDLTGETTEKIGKEVTLYGFVKSRRDHGKLIFFDLRDDFGLVQIVANPANSKDSHKIASTLSSEDVVKVIGKVGKRPENNINPDLPTGKIEIIASKIELINKADLLPIPIEGDGYEIDEAVRFKYRYLDLRRSRLQRNLKERAKIVKFVREFLDSKDFIDIETPYLSKTTPEGARDFVVPSRLAKGKFYALAQSPQQYKQLLMIAGFERYYQIARAFRDEDLRADRQFEHTQIDLEMAFVEREDVMKIVEDMVIFAAEKLGKKIAKKPFPVLSYKEVRDKYKTDRPNLSTDKNELFFLWVLDFPLFEKTESGQYTFAHNPFAAPKEESIKDLMEKKNLDNLQSLQYDLVCNGEEIGGGSIRINNPEIQKQVFRIMDYNEVEIEKQFGHLLSAYQYGAPTHGGIALGLDRLAALFSGEDNIREVIAFPVSSSGVTSVMDAPSELGEEQLKELNLKIS